MEEKLPSEFPWIEKIQKFYFTPPFVSSQRTAIITPAPIFLSMDGNARSSQRPVSSPVRSETRRRKTSPISLLLEAASSTVVYTAVAPLERVKLLLQTQNEQIRSLRLSHSYRGIKDCLFRTIKHEGLLSLWRGNMTHIALQIQTQAVLFAFGTYIEMLIEKKEQSRKKFSDGSVLFMHIIFYNQLAFTHPLNFARTRLACDVKSNGSWQFTTLIDTYQKTFKSNGVAGVYRGYTLALIGDAAGVFIAPFLKKTPEFLKGDKQRSAVYVHVPISMATQLMLYPVDTVCRRMMMTTGEEASYAGVQDAFRQIIKREGWSSLYKGVGAFVLRGSIGGLLSYTLLLSLYP